MKLTNKILLILSTFVLTLFFPINSLPEKNHLRTIEGTVINVLDGDTIKIKTKEETILKVRLYGIDAPEIEKYSRKTGKVSKPGQPFGKAAYKTLELKISGKKVKVDVIDIDRYKRMVGVVYYDGRDINLEMVKIGLAWAYRKYLERPYASEYLNAEKEARSKKLGLWKENNPKPPWEFRELLRIS